MVFAGICLIFIAYTAVVLTVGTDEDKGKRFLTENAKHGNLLYKKYNCTACHQLFGLGGYMGPDLTNTMSTPGKGAPYARVMLKFGTQRMPNFNLSDDEVEALVEYLTYVDKSGTSPVRYE